MNCPAALRTGLEPLNIGDIVLTTPFSFIATTNAVRFVGAKPVFVEIYPDTYNLDADAVETALETRDIDAIIVIHLYVSPPG